MRRTMALADALRARGAQVCYVTRSGKDAMEDVLRGAGFPVHGSLEQTGTVDGLVVDHYDLGADWERSARQYARRICVIDDLGRAHDCDVLLDQNLGADSERYAGKVPHGTRLLLGPGYALLREEFRSFVAAPPQRATALGRILVSMGGFDATDETGKVLSALAGFGADGMAVDVVLPLCAPHGSAVAERCAIEGFAHYGTGAGMAELMAKADLAIGAVGGTAWERCLLALPSIVITVAPNQRAGARACDRAGAAVWLGDAEDVDAPMIRRTVAALASDSARLQQLGRIARDAAGVNDGVFSTDRAADAVMEVFNG